jgi:iron complex transport system substrate-binding protein
VRIASLVPSTTEILFAVGAGPDVVARSHECDHPDGVHRIPAVTSTTANGSLQVGLTDRGADTHTAYAIDDAALVAAAPELVFTESLCPACAAGGSCSLPPGSRVVGSDPTSLEEVLRTMIEVSAAAGKAAAGRSLVARLRSRLHWLTSVVAQLDAPRVAVIEWPNPLLAPGRWVPEMVEAAGGINVFGGPGDPSRRTTLEALAAARPEVVVAAFSGLDLYQTQSRFKELASDPVFARITRSARIFAIDGAAYFSRPGPRVIDGIELLAWAVHRPHPSLRPPVGRGAKLIEAGWIDVASLPLKVAV